MNQLNACTARMREAGMSAIEIENFTYLYNDWRSGDAGEVPESSIRPVGDLPHLFDLDDVYSAQQQSEALGQVAVIKLNGGLGTSMGITGAKSSLPVTGGLTFLDIAVRQVLAARERTGAPLPLLLMNSERTRVDSLPILQAYPDLAVADLPPDFLQGSEPKVDAETLGPVDWPADPGLEWCPPGHGDIYPTLAATGLLQTMLDRGFRYAFVSNADNLGATPDGRIAAWMADQDLPFGMEVCRRTSNDRKGGHLAVRLADDRLVLREIAQTPGADLAAFADIDRHRMFNTNSLWIDLHTLSEVLAQRDGVLQLPLIVNRKTVDPADSGSPAVVQLETAMGAAIEVFDGGSAIEVSRSRFRPVKTTNELMLVRSDNYRLTPAYELAATSDSQPFVDLDPQFFKLIGDFDARTPHGVPSLREATSLVVRGDVRFGKDVRVVGDVELDAPDDQVRVVPDGSRLGG